jgi:hypothetical protein
MASNRIFYACQSVSLGGNVLTGVQSVGLNTNFAFDQVFQLGQIEIYENLEGIPDVEISIERVLDGNTGNMYSMFGSSLATIAAARKTAEISVYDDAFQPAAGGSIGVAGSATASVKCTGLYLSNYSVNFNLEGPSTESITLVGNAKDWSTPVTHSMTVDTDGPVVQRKDVTVSSAPAGNHFQSCTFSIDFGREDLLQLGQKTPYYRAASFPVESTAEFVYNATDATVTDSLIFNDGTATDVTSEATYSVSANAGGLLTHSYSIPNARVTGIQFGGGDAGGGNATVTYNVVAYNSFTASST